MIPDLPTYLVIPQDERKAAWRGVKLTIQGSAFRNQPTKVEEAATKKLRKEIEAAEVAKKVARFAALKADRELQRTRRII